MSELQIVMSGRRTICCIHDRKKRQVVTEAQVAQLGLSVGQVYDAKQHKMHLCACCENLFVDPTDVPRFCSTCLRPFVHQPNSPPPEPKGVVG